MKGAETNPAREVVLLWAEDGGECNEEQLFRRRPVSENGVGDLSVGDVEVVWRIERVQFHEALESAFEICEAEPAPKLTEDHDFIPVSGADEVASDCRDG